MTRPRLLLPTILAVLTGCTAPGGGGVSMDVPMLNNQTIRVELSKKTGLVQGEDDDIRVETAILRINPKTKQGHYDFGFLEKKKIALKRVTVEDVSEDSPVTWAVDAQPELKEGHWSWSTQNFDLSDPRAKWLFEVESAIRVSRFTIVTADGRTIVIYGYGNYPLMLKYSARMLMGLEKAPKAP